MGIQSTRFFGPQCALRDESAYELISNSGSSDSENSEVEWRTILQFTSALYFVEEHEATVQIDIMRLGSQSGQVSVNFHTEDMTGKAGERFEETHGCLVLDDGEHQKSISVPIVVADTWAPTLEFKVCLTRPKGAKLGAYLHTCRVKVIDDQSFPSSKYPQVTGNLKEVENIGAFLFFFEYFKLMFSVPGIGGRTLLCMIFDQLRNAYTYYKLWAIAYLLNHVLHGTHENPSFTIDERAQEAVFIGAGYMLPMIALHAWDLTKTQLDLTGRAKTYLQKAIITKYLNYSTESRAVVDIADIEIAIKEDARETAETYVAALELFRIAVKLIVVLGFVRKENPNSIQYVIAMLVLMFVFASLRSTSLSRANALPITLAARLQSHVADIGRNYRLIANYLQRPQVNDTIDHKVAALRTAEASPNFVRVNNDYFTQWLGPLFVGMYIMTHARFVLLGELGHGTFIATLNVFNEYSANFSVGYKESMKITANAGTLANITRMLNLPTDLLAWKAVNRVRRARTKEAREAVLAQHHDNPFPTDLIPFQFKHVGFGFAGKENIMRGLNLTVPQGCMVALRGGHGQGKQTLLRLIAHELFPTEGEIFIPTHLRILHVSQEVYMLDTNPLLNLTFGHVGVEIERVRVVLEHLGITKLWDQVNAAHGQQLRKTMLSSAKSSLRTLSSKSTHRSSTSLDSETAYTEDLEEDFLFNRCSVCSLAEEPEFESTDCTWLNALSYSERAKVHLARALIMNPEVMILQRPLVHFNQAEQSVILHLLREHVQNRGLALPRELMRMRRPRTVFLSVETPEQADKADIVWEMCRDELSMGVKVKRDSTTRSQSKGALPPSIKTST